MLSRLHINDDGYGHTSRRTFSNLDAGFEGKELRKTMDKHRINPNRRNGCEPIEDYLFDEEMYRERWIVERTKAWMDGFKAVHTRFDTIMSSRKGWYYLAFIVISIKKIHNSDENRQLRK
ncbi:MAG: hypothetical protein NC201_02320 [Prevotella sp.]|nr:hypothetical protein [Bacteroides sp.]MCM1366061.1 hypothetical protein [Prevotella sp.]MCM1436546.1 hypothetical protein [Prevotella sp.]